MRYTILMFALTADFKQITCIDGQGLDMCLTSPIKDELEKDKRQFLDDAEKGGAGMCFAWRLMTVRMPDGRQR